MSEFYTVRAGLFQLEVRSENLKVAGILPGDMAVFRLPKDGECVEGKFVAAA
jgi:SOS-response transcriptional repressor LexA